jgi:hypothetical protein
MITRVALLVLHCDYVDGTRSVRKHCEAQETFGGGPTMEQALECATRGGWTIDDHRVLCRHHSPGDGQ